MSGINFSPVASDTAKEMLKTVDYILGIDIAPEDKIARLNTVFNLVGSDFYLQMFDANSELYDSTAIGTTDFYDMTDQIERLSRKIVQNYNLDRSIDRLVKDFYDSALGKVQDSAFRNAVSLDKHPTLTRTIVGETCRWCVALAGVHVNPTSDMFRRHADCDCLFVTSGYNSRNGILTNYNKSTRNKVLGDVFNKAEPGVGRVRRTNDLQIPDSKSHEKSIAKWLLREVGGEYVVLDESKNPSHHMPDLLRNNSEVIEIKQFSSLTSIGNRVRKASLQLDLSNLKKEGINIDSSARRILVLDAKDSHMASKITDAQISGKILEKQVEIEKKGQDFNIDYVLIKRKGKKIMIIKP